MHPYKPTYTQAVLSESRLSIKDKGRIEKASQVEETLNQQPIHTSKAVKAKRKEMGQDVLVFLETKKEDPEKFL